MTPLDTLKAGVKTAVITFATSLLALLVGVLDALAEWAQGGAAPDLGTLRGLVVAAVLALLTGLLNTVARFLQVAGPGFIGRAISKVLGSVPVYPEDETKVIERA